MNNSLGYVIPWRRRILPVFVVLVATWTCYRAQAAESLRWKLKTGDRLRVTTTQQTDSTVTYSGKSVKTSLELVVDMLWTVDKATDDEAKITQQIERLHVSLTSPNDPPLEYDSAAEKRPSGAARQLEAALKPLLDQQFHVTMNARGEIVKVQSPPSTTPPDTKKNEKGAVSADTLDQLLQQSLVVLPEKEVSKGDTWKAERATTTPLGKLQQTTTYTLADITGEADQQTAKITQSGQLELAPANKKLKLTAQSLDGMVRFALEPGRVVSAERTQRLKTEQPYRETTIVVDLETRITTKVEPAEAK